MKIVHGSIMSRTYKQMGNSFCGKFNFHISYGILHMAYEIWKAITPQNGRAGGVEK